MNPEIIFDDRGRRWRADSAVLARILRYPRITDVIDYAVRRCGFILVQCTRNSLILAFEPSVVSPAAACAAFYEVMERAPKRVVFAYPSTGGCSRYEVLPSDFEALRRLEKLTPFVGEGEADSPGDGLSESVALPFAARCSRTPMPNSRKIMGFRGRDGLTVRIMGDDTSQRVYRPVDPISPLDDWMGRVLGIWRVSRVGTRLPASASLASLAVVGVVCGRAHLVDTSDTDPMGYWFRVWGPINSYKSGDDGLSLGAMYPGLMREGALEDYQEAVAARAPSYTMIKVRESAIDYSYSRLILPLKGAGDRVDHLLVLINERDLTLEHP
jgi:hypothetical protein